MNHNTKYYKCNMICDNVGKTTSTSPIIECIKNYKIKLTTSDDNKSIIKKYILSNMIPKQQIQQFVGPVYNDLTVSADEYDAITFDQFLVNGKPVFDDISMLFSYIDTNGDVRCFTLYSVHHMASTNNWIHPTTLIALAQEDIDRASTMLNTYQCIAMPILAVDDETTTFRKKLVMFFKQFHQFNINFEPEWLISITKIENLVKIINDSKNLMRTNTNWKEYFDLTNIKLVTAFSYQQYILDQWQKLFSVCDYVKNQICIWLIIIPFMQFIPDIKLKYPGIAHITH